LTSLFLIVENAGLAHEIDALAAHPRLLSHSRKKLRREALAAIWLHASRAQPRLHEILYTF
jgi:hypothetical protein